MTDMPTENESFGRRASYTPTEKFANADKDIPMKTMNPTGPDKTTHRVGAYDHNSNYPRNSFQSTNATADDRRCKKCPILPLSLFVGLVLIILAIVLPIVLSRTKQKIQVIADTAPLRGSVVTQLNNSHAQESFFEFLSTRCRKFKERSADTSEASNNIDEQLLTEVECEFESLKSDYIVAKLADMLQKATNKTKLCSSVSCDTVRIENVSVDDEFLNFDFQVDLRNRHAHGAGGKRLILKDLSPSEITLTTRDELAKEFELAFPGFRMKDTIVEFDLQHLCLQERVTCPDDVMTIWAASTDAPRAQMPTEPPVTAVSEGDYSVENLKENATKMITCQRHGFRCLDEKRVINKRQICDGVPHCDDGSDELNCATCATSFSCNGDDDKLKCLRGNSLCDGNKDCQDGSDETTYCRSNCSLDEHLCKHHNICIPLNWVCDGDVHCPEGDDESSCKDAQSCRNGAQFCSINGSCTAQWYRCDGISHCPNGEDEADCTCQECSADHLALCTEPGYCIGRKYACDGVANCPNEEDELNCPGYCKMETKPDQIQCPDKVLYPRSAVCAGRVASCRESCPECDPEEAFRCAATGSCIERNKICDGKADCLDSSDENATLCDCDTSESFVCNSTAAEIRCIPLKYRCDGYHDCLGSEDEADCDSCFNNPNAFYCNSTKTCYPKSARCNGEVDCPDYSDEDYCTCTDCKNQLEPTFVCNARSRCLLRRHVCNPLSPYHCPGRVAEDETYCPPFWDPFRGMEKTNERED